MAIAGIALPHPTRVAVDGITASGKTTFAQELTQALSASGRAAIHLTMDGFHNPRALRHRQGRQSADGYYEDAYDFDALVREVLVPLGPDGNRAYRSRILDLDTDAAVAERAIMAPRDAVVVVDGSFLQRPETAGLWDFVVWLDVPFEVARARGVVREADEFGGPEKAGEMYDVRYHAAARRYLAECSPQARATLVLDNTDPLHPVARDL